MKYYWKYFLLSTFYRLKICDFDEITNSVSYNHIVSCKNSILDNNNSKFYFYNDMSNLSCSQITRRRLIEIITLLWTLIEISEQSKKNKLNCENDETKQFITKRKKQLVNNFAFISISTNDMFRIMIVCIEKNLDQNKMTIRLTSNIEDFSRITKNFKNIARTLQKTSLKDMIVLIQRIENR